MIRKNIQILSDTIDITDIVRVGLRYISSFDIVEKLSDSFKFGFDAPLSGYTLEDEFFRTQLCKDDINILLQLVKNAEITRNEQTQKRTLIDIDMFQHTHLPSSIGHELFVIIQKLHTEEKNLFFSLLREDFLAKLNCEY